jgi:hypothetical protein
MKPLHGLWYWPVGVLRACGNGGTAIGWKIKTKLKLLASGELAQMTRMADGAG